MTSLDTFSTNASKRNRTKPDRNGVHFMLIAIIKEKPKATKQEHRAECIRTLLEPGYEEYLEGALNRIISMDYDRAYDSVFTPTKNELAASAKKRATEKKTEEVQVGKAKAIIRERIADMVLLDLVMANGKKLRDCTGYECTTLGGWLIEVGKRVGANKKVGDVLSEKAIAALLK